MSPVYYAKGSKTESIIQTVQVYAKSYIKYLQNSSIVEQIIWNP